MYLIEFKVYFYISTQVLGHICQFPIYINIHYLLFICNGNKQGLRLRRGGNHDCDFNIFFSYSTIYTYIFSKKSFLQRDINIDSKPCLIPKYRENVKLQLIRLKLPPEKDGKNHLIIPIKRGVFNSLITTFDSFYF